MADECEETNDYRVHAPDFGEAKKLCNGQYTCLNVQQRVEEILLPYRFLSNVYDGITATLKEKNLVYCHQLAGVVLAFGNVHLLQDQAKVVDELPVLVVKVQVEYVVFKPTVGSTLIGVVTRIGADYFGLLVHQCINASIHLKKKKLIGLQLQVGKNIAFLVKTVYTEDGLLSIGGKLHQSHKTGSIPNEGNVQDTKGKTTDSPSEIIISNGGNDDNRNNGSLKRKKDKKKDQAGKKAKKKMKLDKSK
ncbi:DNA-directed RNA polymerase I subunit RPA43 [Trichoplax sp. H2]|nr:DNA-directed RNA polymerase I subunit RPA43 [Trichoplax sp. H2]|eukprot:RDD39826.1 DNA-directed RNA polymerase I subunit RPA43 [Trichoplax sp. H2]